MHNRVNDFFEQIWILNAKLVIFMALRFRNIFVKSQKVLDIFIHPVLDSLMGALIALSPSPIKIFKMLHELLCTFL